MGFGRSGAEPLPFLPTTYMEQEESYPFAQEKHLWQA